MRKIFLPLVISGLALTIPAAADQDRKPNSSTKPVQGKKKVKAKAKDVAKKTPPAEQKGEKKSPAGKSNQPDVAQKH
jgi:hypothetical protein